MQTRLLSGDGLSHGQERHRSSATCDARPSPRQGATPETIPAVVQRWPSGHEGYPLCPCSCRATQALIRLCAHSRSMGRWLTLVARRTWRSR